MKKHYEVVGKLSEINIEEIVNQSEGKNKTQLKKIVATTVSTLLLTFILQDEALANSINDSMILANANTIYKTPTQLKSLLEFISWLIDLLRLIVSSVAGLICTFAGYKWATSLESNGQETAKKILKNAFVGGLIVWTGSSIAGFFVDKMNEILL